MPLKFKPLAKTVADREGGKINVNIAQISEIIKLTLEELAKVPASEAMALVEKYQVVRTTDTPKSS